MKQSTWLVFSCAAVAAACAACGGGSTSGGTGGTTSSSSAAGTGGSTSSSSGCSMATLTVNNVDVWCTVSVNGGTPSAAAVQTVCVPDGMVPMRAIQGQTSIDSGRP